MLMDSDTPLLILTTKEIENYLKEQHLAEPEISAIESMYQEPDFSVILYYRITITSEQRYLQDITKNNWREKASN